MHVLIDGIPYRPVVAPPPRPRGRTLGAIVRHARQAHRWTLVDLAREAAVSPSFLSELENDKRAPSLRTAATLARVLGVKLDDLAAGLEGKP